MNKKWIILLLFWVFAFNDWSQNEIPKPSIDRIHKEIIRLVNQHRDSIGVRKLNPNGTLSKAAKDQSIYLNLNNKLSHDQPTYNKQSPQERVFFYGGNFNYIGENVAFIHALKNDSTFKTEKTIAQEFFQAWLNSPPHRENMESTKYYQIGVGLSLNTTNGKIYGAQVFSALGYDFPKRLETPKRAYGVQSFNEGKCKGMKNFKYGTLTFANGIYTKDDSVFIYYHDKQYFRKIIENANDGYAVDIVFKDQLPCDSPNLFHGSDIFDGYMLEPIFLYDLLRRDHSKNPRKLNTYLGKLPPGISKFELNLILIKDNHKCDYSYPVEVPSADIPLFDIEPCFFDTEYEFKTIEIDTQIVLNFEFERSSTEWKNNEFRNQFKAIRKYQHLIDSINIKTYSSVEGKSWFNIRLQEERAKKLHALFSFFIGTDSIINISAKENWELFEQQVKELSLTEFEDKTQDEVKNIFKRNKGMPLYDSLLYDQRKSETVVYIKGIIDSTGLNENAQLIWENANESKNEKAATHILYTLLKNDQKWFSVDAYDSLFFNSPLFSCNYLAFEINRNGYVFPDGITHPSSKKLKNASKEYTFFVLNWLNFYYNHVYRISNLYYHSIDEHIPEVSPEESLNYLNSVDTNMLDNVEVINKLRLNYALSGIRYYSALNQWSKTNALFKVIFDYFYRADLSIEELTDLALFCNFYHKYDKTVMILDVPFEKDELDEDAAFVLAKTATLIQDELEGDLYIQYMKEAYNKNPSRWCHWLENNFQVKRNEIVKGMYCEVCL